MGLDMYLNAERFLSAYAPEESKLRDKIKKIAKVPEGLDINTLKCEAFYWRKANAIHNWFVANVQHGTDDCGDYYASREKLQELVDVIDQVLDDHDLAQDLLPTGSGFFFGSTDYEEYYYQELERTRDGFKRLLANEELAHWDFHYHSSW